MAKAENVKTNGGSVAGNAVLKRDTAVAAETDGPLVTLAKGIPARELTDAQLAQLHPDHFVKEV